MSIRLSHHGDAPWWVQLSGSPDVEASGAFYSALFGWRIEESSTSTGHRHASKDGKEVAGISPALHPGQPHTWVPYVPVADVAAAVERARMAGGQPLDAGLGEGDEGNAVLLGDAAGAVIGIWQSDTFAGAGLVGAHGTLGWTELGTRDVGGARDFYGAVLDWSAEERPAAGARPYYFWKEGRHARGGMKDITMPVPDDRPEWARVPDEVPTHWLVYFAVSDADLAARTAAENGGQVLYGPGDVPDVGRLALIADPAGAGFAVVAPS